MASDDGDREGAVREVTRVYELIKTKQPLLLHQHNHHQQQLLAQSLLGDAMRALNIALSVMKQQQISRSTAESEPSAEGKRRRRAPLITTQGRKNPSSWNYETQVPHEDGYEWRKYGEKRINGTNVSKSYFRCTYKDDAGCQATKHVQQRDNNSYPPVFQVTYNNEHTCKHQSSAAALLPPTMTNKENNNSNPLPLAGFGGAAGSSNPPPPPPITGDNHVMINQFHDATTVTMLPPPPAQVAAAGEAGGIPSSATIIRSSTDGEGPWHNFGASWRDELDMIMMESPIDMGDDINDDFQDLELPTFLYNNFNDKHY